MDVYAQYRNHRRGCLPAVVICVIIALLFLVACISGCRVLPDHSKTTENVDVRDSIILHHVYDTIRVTITDTTHVEVHSSKKTEDGTEINFGNGGGTYNSKTGEATNVSSVKHSSTVDERRDSIADMKFQLTVMRAHIDSLSEQVNNYSIALAKERTRPTRTGWDEFKTWWFWITVFILLAVGAFWICDKIPATKPYATMIKAFFKIR